MKPTIIVYRELPEPEKVRLQSHFHIIEFKELSSTDDPQFIEALNTAEGLIGAGLPLKADVLDKAPKLKALSTISVGTDAFDLNYLGKRGIPLMHTPTVLTETTADTIFTLILASARRAVELDKFVRSGQWQSSIGPDLFGSNVHGKTLGILGLGRIGSAVARRAHHGFGMRIQYYNHSRKAEAEAEFDARKMSLDELLRTSDFVCSVLPYVPETHHLIDEHAFAMMKESAFFINGGRGKTVDQAALVNALEQNVIKGAGLDVFEQEPLPADSPLMTLDNVVLLPHIGSATHETRDAMARCAVDNLISALNGDISINCANQSQLEVLV
ncbi:2-hydroxyacid dehydrogenase [Vibrio nitrifigilis]|uniref:D-glycerate dehydrogenase n=1 Tax=Vibrio nitrifigilis TaxID=2789781 RepID=A0ABS0GJG4_9VIBR|nr:D-glycerate dehydrogenase [Vibrio nitrifigilis]MBF9002440.1 D-glycerate dehydrogenase [Vibrio nitrifigilis]